MFNAHKWLKEAVARYGKGQSALDRELAARLGRKPERSKLNKSINASGSGKARKLRPEELIAISEITGHPIPPEETEIVQLFRKASPERQQIVTDILRSGTDG